MNSKNNPRKNKISFVVAARNDDYGGNFINRMKTSLRVLSDLAKKYDSDFEYIVVEWNPPTNKELLHRAINLPSNKNISIKYIEIPAQFHQQFPNSQKIPLFEYIAKNIGARRAVGDYIIALNPDIILGEDMVEFLTYGSLDQNTLYRANRIDLSINHFDDNLDTRAILRLSKKNIVRIISKAKNYVSFKIWINNIIHKPTISNIFSNLIVYKLFGKFRQSTSPHDGAAGDFLMMHRSLWDAVGGYDQAPLSSFMDGYILWVAICMKAKQNILPYSIFHMSHEYAKGQRPEVDILKYKENCRKMQETGIPYLNIKQDWGYPSMKYEIFTS